MKFKACKDSLFRSLRNFKGRNAPDFCYFNLLTNPIKRDNLAEKKLLKINSLNSEHLFFWLVFVFIKKEVLFGGIIRPDVFDILE